MECPRAHFHIQGLEYEAALLGPIGLQGKDQILKGRGFGQG